MIHYRRGPLAAKMWFAVQASFIAGPHIVDRIRLGLKEIVKGLWADIRHTLRGLARCPVVTVVAILSLALGIGLTATASSIVDALWFAALPYPEPDRLVDMADTHPVEVCEGCSAGTSYRSYTEWKVLFEGAIDVAALSGRNMRLSIGDRRQVVPVAAVSGNLARVLGAKAELGRLLGPEDDGPGAERVIVLGHGLWSRAYGADPGVMGTTIRLDGEAFLVVGVLAESTRAPGRSEAWVPLGTELVPGGLEDRNIWVIGRMSPGVGYEDADRRVSAFASKRYAEAGLDPGWSALARPLRDSLREDAPPRSAGTALLLATLLVLLIASLNLAALLLTRVTERERELSVRVALGSSTLRLLRFAGMEALVLALAGGVGGVLLAAGLTTLIQAQAASILPGWVDVTLDRRALLAAALLTVLTVVLCGTLPLLSAAAVRPGGFVSRLARRAGPARLRKHDWLLGAQVALGIVLVAGTVTSVGTFLRLSNFDTLGFRTAGIASVRVSLEPRPADDSLEAWAMVSQLSETLGRQPGASFATPIRSLFLGSWGGADAESPVRVEGAEAAIPNAVVPRHSAAVGPGYFELLDIPLVAGRGITTNDAPGNMPAAVVSRRAGATMWPGDPPQALPGHRFHIDGPDGGLWFTVVGVAEDVVANYRNPSRRTQPRIYTSLAQTPGGIFQGRPGPLSLLFESRGPLPPARELESLLSRVDEGIAVLGVGSLRGEVAEWVTPVRITTQVLAGLSALALALLALGVYGTVSYRVATSRFDMAVRVVLGAEPWALIHSVSSRVARVLGLAALAGSLLSIPLGRATAGGDLPLGGGGSAVVAAVLLLATVCCLACLPPIRNAGRVDPMESLRGE